MSTSYRENGHLNSGVLLPGLVSAQIAGQQAQRGQGSVIVLHRERQVGQSAHLALYRPHTCNKCPDSITVLQQAQSPLHAVPCNTTKCSKLLQLPLRTHAHRRHSRRRLQRLPRSPRVWIPRGPSHAAHPGRRRLLGRLAASARATSSADSSAPFWLTSPAYKTARVISKRGFSWCFRSIIFY